MEQFQRLRPKLSTMTILHSKETIAISSDDSGSITDIEEEGFYDNDITSKFKATEDIIFRGSKK